jgi:hypothetical protein
MKLPGNGVPGGFRSAARSLRVRFAKTEEREGLAYPVIKTVFGGEGMAVEEEVG